jgi:4-hydroxy-3-polyprenylbenzoate decarboxylase
MTGASGVVYGVRLLEVLGCVDDVETHLVISGSARRTLRLETDYTAKQVALLADVTYRVGDIGAALASGSFRTDGMVVVPCTVKTLSGIANSYAENLLQRAADVTLKDRRPLVLVVRETPLHLGHLRLMAQVTEMGAIVMPPVPAFYHRPERIEDIVDHTVSRLLDLLGIELEEDLVPRWSGGSDLEREAVSPVVVGAAPAWT